MSQISVVKELKANHNWYHVWESHLKEHFREEEVLLFDRLEDDLCRKGKSDHRMIEERIRHLNGEGSETTHRYLAFAELLAQHIHFEERTLFPHLEDNLPAPVLQQVGDFLSAEHPETFIDNYPDLFWSKNYCNE